MGTATLIERRPKTTDEIQRVTLSGMRRTEEQRQLRASAIAELHAIGWTMQEIGDAFGVSRQSIYDVVNRHRAVLARIGIAADTIDAERATVHKDQ